MTELKPCAFCGKQPVIAKDKRYLWIQNFSINAYEVFAITMAALFIMPTKFISVPKKKSKHGTGG